MRRSKSITLTDVALEAGVAKMTASVVLNGARSGTKVSEATRTRIIETATRLGYRPNGIARGLSRRRIDSIGVVTDQSRGLNLYFLEIFNGILEAATAHQQAATVFTIRGWASKEIRADLLRLCDGRVDGLILLGPHAFALPFAGAIQQHTPLVAIHAAAISPDIYNMDVDNEGGIYAATRHLIELGHRRIAHLQGSMDDHNGYIEAGAKERLAGYRRAIEEAGIPYDPALVLPGYYVPNSGRERVEQLLASGSPFPTALVCANDAIAAGSIEALKAHGLRIPEDVSVTGFDDVLTTQLIKPALTTVRQPFGKLGYRAVEVLLEQIDGFVKEASADDDLGEASEPEPRVEVLDVELVMRDSTGPPRIEWSKDHK